MKFINKKLFCKSIQLLTLFLLLLCQSCYTQESNRNNFHLKDIAPFPIGASIDANLLKSDSLYRKVILDEFNSITPENQMKMNRLLPDINKYNWNYADSIIQFGQQNNIRVHGHTLVWHRAIPKWVSEFKGDSTAWERLLKTYITTVVNRYKDKVTSWDVVNEALDDSGHVRNSIWFKHLGKGYIERSFIYAHEADPKALLFYNDYLQEGLPIKSNAIKEMLLDFQKRKIPINGVGLQLHTTIYRKNSDIARGLKDMVETNLLIHISELTVNINRKKETASFLSYTPDIIKIQIEKFTDIFKMYQNIVPPKQQYGITTWNVGDKDSYLFKDSKGNEFPQMFDTNYNKKEYFYMIRKSFNSKDKK
jgi:endo-1,4-beta-xylanase